MLRATASWGLCLTAAAPLAAGGVSYEEAPDLSHPIVFGGLIECDKAGYQCPDLSGVGPLRCYKNLLQEVNTTTRVNGCDCDVGWAEVKGANCTEFKTGFYVSAVLGCIAMLGFLNTAYRSLGYLLRNHGLDSVKQTGASLTVAVFSFLASLTGMVVAAAAWMEFAVTKNRESSLTEVVEDYVAPLCFTLIVAACLNTVLMWVEVIEATRKMSSANQNVSRYRRRLQVAMAVLFVCLLGFASTDNMLLLGAIAQLYLVFILAICWYIIHRPSFECGPVRRWFNPPSQVPEEEKDEEAADDPGGVGQGVRKGKAVRGKSRAALSNSQVMMQAVRRIQYACLACVCGMVVWFGTMQPTRVSRDVEFSLHKFAYMVSLNLLVLLVEELVLYVTKSRKKLSVMSSRSLPTFTSRMFSRGSSASRS